MAKWMHSRQGVIEGEIVWEDEEWYSIELSKRARVTYRRTFVGHGRENSHAGAGETIRVRKCLVEVIDNGKT